MRKKYRIVPYLKNSWVIEVKYWFSPFWFSFGTSVYFDSKEQAKIRLFELLEKPKTYS